MLENSVGRFFKILSGFAVVNILKSLMPFALLPVLTRVLTAADYGVLSIYESTILIMTPLMFFSVQGLLSARYYRIGKNAVAELNANAFSLALYSFMVVQIAFFVLHKYIQIKFNIPDLFINFIPLFVLLRFFNTYISNLWQTQHDVRLYGTFSLGAIVLDLGLSLLLVVVLSTGYKGRLSGVHFALGLSSVVGIYLMRSKGLLKWSATGAAYREIFKFGVPLIPHAIGGVSLALANRYFLANQLGSASVGIYTVAYQVASIMLLVGTTINQAWSVSLFKLLGAESQKNTVLIRKLMIAMVGILLFSCASLYYLGDYLFLILAGKKFEDSKQYYPYLLLGFLLQSVYFVFVNFDFYEERVMAIGFTTLFTACVNIILNILLIPALGIMGSAYASLASMALYMILVIIRVFAFNKSFRQVWLA